MAPAQPAVQPQTVLGAAGPGMFPPMPPPMPRRSMWVAHSATWIGGPTTAATQTGAPRPGAMPSGGPAGVPGGRGPEGVNGARGGNMFWVKMATDMNMNV